MGTVEEDSAAGYIGEDRVRLVDTVEHVEEDHTRGFPT